MIGNHVAGEYRHGGSNPPLSAIKTDTIGEITDGIFSCKCLDLLKNDLSDNIFKKFGKFCTASSVFHSVNHQTHQA